MLPILELTNSLGRKKEQFVPLQAPYVKLYVCGITPYDHAHLGHARCYVAFDILVRLLRISGYKVTYVRNYTDIDDKIINAAAKSNITPEQLATRFIASYQEDMASLNCMVPDAEPRVTTHISEIITFIEELINIGNAYTLNGDVYFDISSYVSYGALSDKKLDDLVAGSRVEVNELKKSPGDFALWKGNANQEFWPSPWGFGRPGWHIECSAMVRKHLGDTIDIHGGGMDLIFPHHENELAQSKSLIKKPLSSIWLHNAFININQEKMSKSLNNALNLKQLFEIVDPMVLRFYFLQHHYRTPLDFELSILEGVKTAYKKLCALTAPAITEVPETEEATAVLTAIMKSLLDDLNTPKALGIIFENISLIKNTSKIRQEVVIIIQECLGLTLNSLTKFSSNNT